jgi:hypothetical protein
LISIVFDSNINNNNINNGQNGKRLRLRRPNHSSELITALNECLTEECFTDATLVCDDQTIKVHKIILSLFSPYFKRTFKLITNSCHYSLIAIKNIPFIDLKAIVEFIYCGEVSIPKQQLNSLLKSAENLEIEGLRSDNCSTFNGMQTLANNSNGLSFSNIVNNNPIIASTLLSIPPALKWSSSPSNQKKRVRKSFNNKVLNTNSTFIPNNNSSQVINSMINNYSKNQSKLSIVNLVPVSRNQQKNNDKQNKVVFKRTPIKNLGTQQNNKIISISNETSNSDCVSIDLKQTNERFLQNESNEMDFEIKTFDNSSKVSTINDKSVMSSTNTRAKTQCEGLFKLYDISNEDKIERKKFLDLLIEFHSSNGTSIAFCPTINKQILDLYRLYIAVKERGGYEKVTKNNIWIDFTKICGIARNAVAATALKLHYKKHLLPFECKFDRNGIDPNVLIESLYRENQNQEIAVSHDNPNSELSKVSEVNNNQTLNETVLENNSEQIEEIWLEDDDEVVISHSKEEFKSLSSDVFPNSLQTDQMEIRVLGNIKSEKGFRPNNSYNKTLDNEMNSIKRKVKTSSPLLKCNDCCKEFSNDFVFKLHVKSNCNKDKPILRPNITL